MEKDELIRLGSALKRARKAKSLSQSAVAEVAGVTSQAVGQWERGQNGPSMAKLIAVGKLLEINVDAALNGEIVAQPNPGNRPAEVQPISGENYPDFGPQDIEVRGVAVGGRDSDFHFNGEVINFVRRPPGIRNARGVFALYVVSDSASPRYEPGDLLYVQKLPPSPGDWVVIELYPAGSNSAQDTEQLAGKAYIKKFIKRAGARLICEQLKPSKQLEFDAGDVKAIYRVIPLKELMG